MKPCDCKSVEEAQQCLNHQGLGFNENSITVVPNKVVLKMGHTTINIPMKLFKSFAEWYLTDQERT